MEEKAPKLTNTEEEIDTSSVEHVDESFMEENYRGPKTRSKMNKRENELLLRANALMFHHFNDDE